MRGTLSLTPTLGAVLYNPNLHTAVSLAPPLIVKSVSDAIVRNQNTLMIQKCERFIVASKAESYIYKVTEKRKKNR